VREGGGEEGECEGEVAREEQRLRHWGGLQRGRRGSRGGAEDAGVLGEGGEKRGGAEGGRGQPCPRGGR
jgi:hypothetical protein